MSQCHRFDSEGRRCALGSMHPGACITSKETDMDKKPRCNSRIYGHRCELPEHPPDVKCKADVTLEWSGDAPADLDLHSLGDQTLHVKVADGTYGDFMVQSVDMRHEVESMPYAADSFGSLRHTPGLRSMNLTVELISVGPVERR